VVGSVGALGSRGSFGELCSRSGLIGGVLGLLLVMM